MRYSLLEGLFRPFRPPTLEPPLLETRRRCRRPPLLVAAVALLLASAGQSAANSDAVSYTDLKAQLPEDRQGRSEALESFARSGRPGIVDRITAAKALASDEDMTGRDRLQAQLLVARLYGVMGSSKRKRAMKKAKRLATRLDDRAMVLAIGKAIVGDAALAKLEKANARALKAMARKPGKKGKKGKKGKQKRGKKKKRKGKKRKGGGGGPIKTVQASIDAWQALDDAPRVLAARFALLAAAAPGARSKASRKKLRNKLGALVSDVAAHRDLAPTLSAAHQLAAQLSLKEGGHKQAALHALAADRAARPSAKKPWPSDARDLHGRSTATAALCDELKKRKKLDCGQLEEDRWGDRTFRDFSRGKTRRFNQDKAREVLAEFDSLLKGCIDQSKQLTEFDTEVAFEWTVASTGRVTQYTVRPRHLESGAFRSCTDAAFDAFRYPRFRGPDASVGYAIDIDLADAKLNP